MDWIDRPELNNSSGFSSIKIDWGMDWVG